MSDEARETQVEAAIVNEILTRQWATKQQIRSTREAVESRRLKGPIHKAMLEQRLLKPSQVERLEEFYHKDLQIDRFTVIRKLGSGAMGEVFLAKDDQDQRAAIKLISKRFADDQNFLRRFEREITALAGLHHDHIAGAVAFGRHDGLPFLAMQYIDGPSLAQLLDKHGPLPEAYVLRVVMQIARGIEHVFKETQLVHRDIKPENILVIPEEGAGKDLHGRADQAVLIDFGLARSFSDSERLTMTGITMGTPHYMSPEQIRGSQELDIQSDLYGLGATAYHLLTGRTPYAGTSPGAVMTSHLTEDVPDPRSLVPALSDGTRAVVMTCMAKEINQRYATVNALVNACEHAIEALGGQGMRLLRKPMVLNKPHPKTDRVARNRSRAADPAIAAAADQRTTGSEIDLPDLSSTPSASPPPAPPPPAQPPIKRRDSTTRREALDRMRQKAGQVRQETASRRRQHDTRSQRNGPSQASYPKPTAPPPGSSLQVDCLIEQESTSYEKRGTEALKKLHSDRIKKVKTTAGTQRRAGDDQAKPATRARVKQPANIGIIPMVFLCVSVVILLALVIYRTVL